MSIEGVDHVHHLSGEQHAIVTRVEATMAFMAGDGTAEHVPWLEWQLAHFLSRIGPDDLTANEKVGLVAILGPAFSRLLDPRSERAAVRRPLHLV